MHNLSQLNESLWVKCGVIAIDHLAVTTDKLSVVLNDYLGLPGTELLRGPATNNAQQVDYAFVKLISGMTIEILGIKDNSPISKHVEKGGGVYHLCFRVEDLDFAETQVLKNGALKVVEQREDDAFDDRKVAFFFHPQHGLFEFLQAYPETTGIHNKIKNLTSNNASSKQHVSTLIMSVFKQQLPELDVASIEKAQLGVTKEWDSMKQLLIIMDIEKITKTKFSVNEVTQLSSYQDFIKNLEKKLK